MMMRDMINNFVFLYLDDILIFSQALFEHQSHVRLLEKSLFNKAKKCEFHAQSVHFLGFVIQRVVDWPVPESGQQLQCFLGFANFYRCFIRDYIKVAAPLTRLTLMIHTFVWTPML